VSKYLSHSSFSQTSASLTVWLALCQALEKEEAKRRAKEIAENEEKMEVPNTDGIVLEYGDIKGKRCARLPLYFVLCLCSVYSVFRSVLCTMAHRACRCECVRVFVSVTDCVYVVFPSLLYLELNTLLRTQLGSMEQCLKPI
jgi:hypothetical protein